ncbi:MAG: hypothetical protein HUU46_06390 [Candidatus Hydrogenedentes bacterium]|nr:hypothetical protein [Candidatus Hydrogenedentota bacterium]
MSDRTKRILGGAGIAVVVYFVVLPMLWPEPTVSAVIPPEVGMHESLPIRVSLNAWHRNIDVGNVRFYVDYTATTAVGPKGTFYPELIVERRPRSFAGAFVRNPITWPYAQRFDAEVNLGKYVEQGLIGPGNLIGKIDVTFNYCSGRGGKRIGRDVTRTTTKSVPFRIAIHE